MQPPFSTPRFFLSCALAVAAVFLGCPGAHAAPLHIGHHRSRPLVVGYFPGWGQSYAEPFYVKTMIANHSIKLLDQINYSQGSVAGGRCSVANRKNDLDTVYTRANSVNGRPDNPHSPFRGYFHQLKELKLRYPRLKILISLEGAPAGFMEGAKRMVEDTLAHSSEEEKADYGVIKEKIRADLKRYISKQTQRRPLIMPVILEI